MSCTYRLELTDPDVAYDCRPPAGCSEHYVVRDDGLWVRAFHNEKDARIFAEEANAIDALRAERKRQSERQSPEAQGYALS